MLQKKQGKIGKTIFNLRIVWIALRFCWQFILINVLVLLLSAGITLALNIINRRLVDAVADNAGHRITGIVIGLSVTYMVCYFFKMSSGFIITFGNNFFRYNVLNVFQKLYAWKSYREKQESFFVKEYMDQYNFVGNNIEKVCSFIGNITKLFFSNIGVLFGAVLLFYQYEKILILYIFLLFGTLYLSSAYIAKKEYELEKEQRAEQRESDYYKSLLIKKESAKEIRIFSLQNMLYDKWKHIFEKLYVQKNEMNLKRIQYESMMAAIKQIFRVVAIAILCYGVYQGKYSVGILAMLYGLIENCNTELETLNNIAAKGLGKDEKYVYEFADYIADIPMHEISKIIKYKPEKDAKQFDYGAFETLSLSNVSYQYPNSDKYAVQDLDLTIRKGEIVSILGYNGSGKTTLSKLICGAYKPQQGRIFLNGIEVSGEEELGKRFDYFSVAPQEYSKFSLSMREVISLGDRENADNPAYYEKVIKKMKLSSFFEKYAKGSDTILGKQYDGNGIELSGGEWQKLIIASALFGRHPFYILDEPSASLDPQKEFELLDTLKNVLQGKTAVLISHRIAFARLADRIVFMENGRIAEEGSHEQLMEAGGKYYELFTSQMNLYKGEMNEWEIR